MKSESMHRVLIVSIPGMITPDDWAPLEELAEISYIERQRVTPEELAALCNGYQYLMLNYDVVKELHASFYRQVASQGLRVIATDITGVEWAQPHLAHEHGIALLKVSDYCTDAVAEHILAELLLLTRRLHDSYGDIAEGREPQARKGKLLSEKTLGILGLGAIGQRLARITQSIGMEIIGWNRTPRQVPGVRLCGLEELFVTSDFIAICLKTAFGQDSTVGFVNRALLSSCKKGCIILNQMPPLVIDQDALYELMKSGHIAGYAAPRSNTEGHPLSSLPQVTRHPLLAWSCDESLAALRRKWVEEMKKALVGVELQVVRD